MQYFVTSKAVFVFLLQLGEVSECHVQLTLKLRTATSPASCKFPLDLEAQLQLEASSDSAKVLPHVQLSHGNGLLKDSKVSLLALSSIFDLGGLAHVSPDFPLLAGVSFSLPPCFAPCLS